MGRIKRSTFEPAFESALTQFRNQFNRRLAVSADVQNLLQTASPINGFITRNRLNLQVQNNWAAVRTDLNALASAYGVSRQWNQQNLPPVNSSASTRLSDRSIIAAGICTRQSERCSVCSSEKITVTVGLRL